MTDLEQVRRLVTEIPGPRSRELAARRSAAMPAKMGSTMPVFAARAGGGVMVDVDGNSFIDFGAGIAVVNVGSSAPGVVEAIQRQVEDFTHTCAMVTPYESYVAVCEALNRLTPGDHEKRSMLVNSGAEAVENAVKIARHYTGRDAVVTFEHGFHGRTLLTMTLTAKSMPYKHGFGPFAPEVYRMPFAYPYRCPTGASYDECGPSCAEAAISRDDPRARPRPDRRGHRRAGPGRGRHHRAGRGLPAGARGVLQRQRHRVHRRRGAVGLRPYGHDVRL